MIIHDYVNCDRKEEEGDTMIQEVIWNELQNIKDLGLNPGSDIDFLCILA